MLAGSVGFVARVRGNGLSFPRVEFNPNEAGVGKVEIEAVDGSEIVTTVHLSSVASREKGRALATRYTAALDRIGFFHGVAIENAQRTAEELTPLTASMTGWTSAGELLITRRISAVAVKPLPPYRPSESREGRPIGFLTGTGARKSSATAARPPTPPRPRPPPAPPRQPPGARGPGRC